eukprot:GFUD01036000.1.p1 GENE.GFUD01036000.1~~GFUD01036000.1.p1  ORF type:complete len:509 (-),score=111.87 GFUD01036000.1:306-1832(-)
MFPASLASLACLALCVVNVNSFNISKISTKTSSIPGSGMDKPGISLFGWSNGGSYSVTLCQDRRCCVTEELNTEDDNWEVGHVDWFVGSQISQCRDFSVELGKPLMMNLSHEGSNAGMLEWIKIHPWHSAFEYFCQVGVRLDYSSSHATECVLQESGHWKKSPQFGCNGRMEFCKLRFDQFLFAGTHNSGTGQSDGVVKCAYKNQDLDIVEQLEFGIRFFDLDVIDMTTFGCTGLETGHGSHPDLGLYQCYGRMDTLLGQMREWMDRHPSEIVVLNFGNIEWPEQTIPSLMETLIKVFTSQDGVKISKGFKERGIWPTLGEAVRSNERLFVFIRDSIGAVTENELEFMKEIKVKPGDNVSSKNLSDSEVTITTSYKAGDVDDDCSFVLKTNNEACKSENETETDFLKLSFFSKFGKGGAIGTECIHKMARKCNQWVKQAVLRCHYRDFKPNFLLVDYPNYQGRGEVNIVQLCQLVNMDRALLVNKVEEEKEKDAESLEGQNSSSTEVI